MAEENQMSNQSNTTVNCNWFQLQDAPVIDNPDLTETVWIKSCTPYGRFDKIHLHRIVAHENARPKCVVFYLPGAHRNSEIRHYTERYNFRIHLAKRGIDTYGIDYRWHAIPDENICDFSFMKNWTYQTFLQDIEESIAFAKKISHADRVFLAGFSRGAEIAYYYASYRWKEDLAGLIILDGRAAGCGGRRTHSFDIKGILAALDEGDSPETREFLTVQGIKLKSSIYETEFRWGYQHRNNIKVALQNPHAPSPEEGFSSLLKYLEWNLRSSNWGAAIKKGNFDIKILLKDFLLEDRYGPLIQIIESIGLGDYEGKHPDLPYMMHLNEVDIPLIGFFVPKPILSVDVKSTESIANKDIEIHLLKNQGHFDVLFGEYAQESVFSPMYQWLLEHR